MGYAEAIEQQMLSLQSWQGERGLWQAEHLVRFQKNRARAGMVNNPRELCEGMAILLQEASPYFIGHPICDLLEGAAGNIPALTLRPESIPTPFGWVWFERPLRTPMDPGFKAFLERQLVAAGASPMDALPPTNAIAWVRRPDHLTVLFFSDFNVPHPCLVWSEAIPIGSLWRPYGDETQGRDSFNYMVGLVFTLFLFMEQKILTTSNRAIANRSARKRIAKKLAHVPIVRVVELRRREYQQRDESHDTHVEYTCQWLVRGHWRQQFYPGSGEHRPLWIAPHVKGPSDKPLKAPTMTAYEVVR